MVGYVVDVDFYLVVVMEDVIIVIVNFIGWFYVGCDFDLCDIF